RFAKFTQEPDFLPRHHLHNRPLVELFLWDEDTFLRNTEGSAIRRIGYLRWLRNLAVGLGNAPTSTAVVDALKTRAQHESELVREHVQWALQRHHDNPRIDLRSE
ncbi:MAG: tRNA epoxyqueuosine(34) reductase QueG, partial [Ketobacter sp.]